MKMYNALELAIAEIRDVLTAAGVTDGITLSQEELKTTKATLFWFIELRSEVASSKSTYITFNVTSINAFGHGDGRPLSYKVVINIDLFSNKENVNSIISAIDTSSEAADWDFDLTSSPTYDQLTKLFTYSFAATKVIYDG